jgi:ABC-type branched-subunit amino acid transport system ATPase component
VESGKPASGTHARRGSLLLAAQQLGADYGSANALSDLDLQLEAGQCVAVLGANGAGKSTALRAIAGLHRPVRGEVFFDGRQIARLPAHRIAALGLVLVPEGRQVFANLTVQENIELGAYRRGGLGAEQQALIDALFPKLRSLALRPAGLLSGGEQQMVAIARAIAADPRVMLLDEPSLGLAPAVVKDVFSALSRLREQGLTLLLVDQLAPMALCLADQAYVLSAGRRVYAGAVAPLEKPGVLAQAYLGTPVATDTPC